MEAVIFHSQIPFSLTMLGAPWWHYNLSQYCPNGVGCQTLFSTGEGCPQLTDNSLTPVIFSAIPAQPKASVHFAEFAQMAEAFILCLPLCLQEPGWWFWMLMPDSLMDCTYGHCSLLLAKLVEGPKESSWSGSVFFLVQYRGWHGRRLILQGRR